MTIISFMTANYVARHIGYNLTEGWMQGQNATLAHFAPTETFAARFEEYVRDIMALGFSALDLWLPILTPDSDPAKIDAARAILKQHNIAVTSLAGSAGSTAAELDAACRLATALGTDVIGGGASFLESDRASAIAILKANRVRLGLENHPEKTPNDLRARIGDGHEGWLGAAVDTGWFGTQGYDAARALEELADVLFYVHLKDVRAVGAHDTCQFGAGVVPIQACVQTLQRIGYMSAISVEHEPEDRDPSDEARASLQLLQGWLQA
ncbi:MAG: sugar phosphate isomerase/epimerase family protein [Chloroflexota bacterium]|nr:sugar phosphate isomerase/epimerase family protein [Chloroflexota bacterium]